MKWWRRPHQQQFADLAERLVIPQPFSLEEFCASIAEQRGRPLHLLPLDGPADPDLPCGIWLGLDAADIVFYEASAADILKVHIVLHEIAHMLLGHVAPELDVADDAAVDELPPATEHFQNLLTRTTQAVRNANAPALPIADIVRSEAARIRSTAAAATERDDELGLSPDRIVHLLGRTKFANRQEKDAETLATLILERASRNETGSTSNEAADVLSRLNDAFGHPARGL
ncbi:hypothetical protein ACFOSC_20285 [Streptantibioticus rubrisoli]|uniref:IrrE N-terminal-like domain-containing protein n=1 Tax=Streptantibioticus rubrisoli TaxID=1387313 RepID=A0ABT1PFI9_9ACTN|nr:hypothetical protein [Streptantibioticus rubrisoli]MCQ4043233.1 hypothetical protein [Streptantibioticus rubrisoli]